MKLNKLRLKNIRSYIEQEIEFPSGTTLLAGDVGSGKSTILLAIDFALFGLQRGSLSGSALLRNGASHGSVELSFEIDNIPIIIKRTLKRESTITQDSGYITINNVRQELTVQELKQKVLELLNYPQELLTKSKSLIYRYTVYTPQEEMKFILQCDRDSRIDVLRRVFGIDKYKRIIENSEIFIDYLKQNSKELEGKASDFQEKKKQHEEKQKEIQKINSNLELLRPKIISMQASIKNKKDLLSKLESDLRLFYLAKNKYDLHALNLQTKKESLARLEKSISDIEAQIKNLKLQIKSVKNIGQEKLKEYENSVKSHESVIKELNSQITEFTIKISSSEEIIKKMSSLDTCPLCLQKVTPEHIKRVKQTEQEKIISFTRNLENSKQQLKDFELKLKSSKYRLDTLKQEIAQQEAIKVQLRFLEEKEDTKQKLQKELTLMQEEIKTLTREFLTVRKEVDSFKNTDKEFMKEKELMEELQNKLRLSEIELIGHEKEMSVMQIQIKLLEKEIEEKQLIKLKLAKQKLLLSWLQEHFIALISTIEKKIMLKVHHDFDFLFQKWFDLIIDNELLKIKLDEEFTPVIEQASHELDYDYLSGGEKTAAALAYRLSLNQIINSLVSTIKTKDLLILDEPTDGFSAEQLDRIRLVLEQLEAKQIIIVSHESKIESFVNNLIRLNKTEHITDIVK